MEKMKPWSDIQVKDLGLDVKHMNTEDPSVVNATGFPKNAHISRFNTAEPGSGESVTIGRRRSAETLRSGFASTPFQNRIENRLEKEYTGASRNLTQSLAASQSLEDRSFRKEDTLEYILTDRSGIAQVNPTRSSGGLRSQQDYEMHYADDSLGGDVTYDELLYYLLQVMYLQRLMEQMKRIEANPDMPYLANAFAEDEGLSAQGEGYAYMDMQDSMKGHGMEGQMTQLEDDGAITYKDLFLSTMEVAYFIDVKIKQYPGKHASLYVKAVLDSDMDENDFHGISDNVSLQYWKDEEAHVLFYGVIDDLFLDRIIEILHIASRHIPELCRFTQMRNLLDARPCISHIAKQLFPHLKSHTAFKSHIIGALIAAVIIQISDDGITASHQPAVILRQRSRPHIGIGAFCLRESVRPVTGSDSLQTVRSAELLQASVDLPGVLFIPDHIG